MNRRDWLLLSVGAAALSGGFLLLGVPWQFAVPFGPALALVGFEGGFVVGAASAPPGWFWRCWLSGHGFKKAAERETEKLTARYRATGRWTR